jgi:hypothetical protein
MRIGPRATWEPSESSELETRPDERARAAAAYLAWPVAVLDLVRRAPGSLWYRTHLRQAATLGGLVSFGLIVLLAAPLVLVMSLGGPGLGSELTIRIYVVGMLADAVTLGTAAFAAVSSAVRAARGELFSIPLVTPLSRRLFLRRRG